MSVHIALLRAVNVGGRNPIGMAALCETLAELGFTDARSLLQSGNVVFRSASKRGPELERYLEIEVERRLNLQTRFMVRTAAQWKRIIARNHFPYEAEKDPAHLHVMFLKSKPAVESVKELQAAIAGPEVVFADAEQLYMTYPAGAGNSKLTNRLIESKLGITGTSRNWNTVLKLAAIASEH